MSTYAEIHFCGDIDKAAVSTSEHDSTGRMHLTVRTPGLCNVTLTDFREPLLALVGRMRAALGEHAAAEPRTGACRGPFWIERPKPGEIQLIGWDPEAEHWPALVATFECEDDAYMVLDRLGHRRVEIPVRVDTLGVDTPCPVCRYPVHVDVSRFPADEDELVIEPTCGCQETGLVDVIGYREAIEDRFRDPMGRLDLNRKAVAA